MTSLVALNTRLVNYSAWGGDTFLADVAESPKHPLVLALEWITREDPETGRALAIASAFSSGDLVKGSLARFCGFVVGQHSFKNTSGGTTLSIEIVGMYDLPETRPKGEPQPAL